MRSSALTIAICLMIVVCTPPSDASEVFEGEKALEMMHKMYCGTVEDGKLRFGTWEGRAYSRVQGEKDRHLFNVIGINSRQCTTVEDPEKGEGFRSVSREVMFYLDPETNEIIDTWENPFTGDTVEVVHVANDPVNMRAPAFAVGRDGKPLKIEFQRSGDVLVNRTEVPLFYTNPLAGDYQKYVGGAYHAMEIFDTFFDADELLNQDSLTMSRLAWARISQWLPWMEMGSRPGVMIVNATGFSTFELEDLPDTLVEDLKERYPLYLTAPTLDDARPNETSWTVFKKHVEAKGGGE
jgi:hypothetical protein